MTQAVAISTMTHREAKECVEKINANMNNIRALVLDLYEREGWAALGYKSWRECVTAEFTLHQSYLYSQLDAAKTERNISAIAENIPEGQLRPLAKLRDNPDQQREAWAKAVETAPEGKVTAAHVQKVVRGMTEPEKPKRIINQPIIKQELISREFQSAFDAMVVELKNARAMKWKTTSHKGAIELMQILLTIADQ